MKDILEKYGIDNTYVESAINEILKAQRAKIENIRVRLVFRIEQLKKYSKEYTQDNEMLEAMRCDIKVDQLSMMLKEIEELLEV